MPAAPRLRWTLLFATASLLGGCAMMDGAVPSSEVTLSTVPTPADYVSGGDALIRVDAPAGYALDDLELVVNGRDVTADFRPAPADWLGRPGNALLGRVDGLQEGANVVVARRGGDPVGELTLTRGRGVHLPDPRRLRLSRRGGRRVDPARGPLERAGRRRDHHQLAGAERPLRRADRDGDDQPSDLPDGGARFRGRPAGCSARRCSRAATPSPRRR
jgi:hypothetical protein